MAAITWTNVVDFASELAGVDVDAQNDILAHVNVTLKVDEFGGESAPRLKLARICLAAHFGALSTAGGEVAAGPITQETADNISRSYAARMSGDLSHWDATPYGQLYKQLVRTSAARFPKAF